MPRRRLVSVVQATMLATSGGPLAPVWRFLHALVLRAVAAWLRRAAPGSSAFASGSFGAGRPLYGVSDMDLVIVAPDEGGEARRRVRARWRALSRRAPLVPQLIEVAVLERGELERAASAPAQAYGLRRPDLPAAAYFGPGAVAEPGLLEGPGLYGPMAGWRALGAAAPLPPPPRYDRQATRMAAWLQLQSWWRYALRGCVARPGPRTAYLCVKFVSEPVRMWLWLAHGERVLDREAALRRGLRLMPEEEPAIRAALDLHRRLAARPEPPLDEMLPHLVRLSARIAGLLEREVESHGCADVELDGRDGELALAPAAREAALGRRLPLLDWRALVWSLLPDECLLADPGDPREPAALARAARRAGPGCQPALRHPGLVVLPVADLDGGAGRLRAVQCRATDPVSFALLEGERRARFPEVSGWSAGDWARRSVAEHRAWLDAVPDSLEAPPLARPLGAARAALFSASVEEGAPRLPLTVAAAMRGLADRAPGARGVAEAAVGEYRDWRTEGRAPDPAVARALLDVVRRLDAYSDSDVREGVASLR